MSITTCQLQPSLQSLCNKCFTLLSPQIDTMIVKILKIIHWSAGCFFVHLLLSKGLPLHQCLKISITFTFTVSARRAVLNCTAKLLRCISQPVWRRSLFLFIFSEALFGMAPFASGSFAELEKKIRSPDPVTVRHWFCSQLHHRAY